MYEEKGIEMGRISVVWVGVAVLTLTLAFAGCQQEPTVSPGAPGVSADLMMRDAPSLAKMLKETEGPGGGYVDNIHPEGNKVRFSGWARDPVAMAPAKAIYAYVGDRVVGAAKPLHLRPDVTLGLITGAICFRITVPSDTNIHAPDHRLRFFSLNPSNKVYEVVIHPPLLPEVEAIFKRP